MTFHSLPFAPREVKATESRLERIYAAAYMGLRGDSLALAAGLLPSEYKRLVDFDPMAEMAALKGRADAELEHATHLTTASRNGDAKASLEILKHVHGWASKSDVAASEQSRQINIIIEGVTSPYLTHQPANVIEGEVLRERSKV